jgi:hypothetical protein
MSSYRAFAVALALSVSPIVVGAAFAGDLPPGPVPYVRPAVRPALSPMEPVAVAPAPIAVDHWDTYGFGDCRYPGDYFGYCGGFAAYAPLPPGAPIPYGARRPHMAYRPGPGVYIVNQGPEYSGPGFMVSFKTYSPTTGLAGPRQFPYISARHIYHPLGVRG